MSKLISQRNGKLVLKQSNCTAVKVQLNVAVRCSRTFGNHHDAKLNKSEETIRITGTQKILKKTQKVTWGSFSSTLERCEKKKTVIMLLICASEQ